MVQLTKTDVSYRTLHRIADRLTPDLRRAFLRAIDGVRDSLNVEQLATLLERNRAALDGEDFWRAVEAELGAGFRPAIREAVVRTGQAAAQRLGMRFDLTNPHALQAIESAGAKLVTEVTDETRSAIRSLVRESFEAGVTPADLARRVRQHIGLTERYSQAVERYRERQVANLGEARGNLRADRYADRLLRHRAETIARTEVIGAANAGQQAAWRQAQAEGLIPPGQKRVWIVTPDDRLDPDICAPMDGQVRGMNEPFTTGEGDHVMLPPAHPGCRCALGLAVEEE